MTVSANQEQDPASASPVEDALRPLWVVTGAAGFLGNNLVRLLLDRGEDVRAAIIEEDTPPSLEGLDVEIVRMDVRDLASVKEAFQGPPGRPVWVVHCAGIVSIATTVSAAVHEVNVGGVANVLEACREEGVARLVYVSSVHALPTTGGVGVELDRPEDFDPGALSGEYSRTKAEATAMVLEARDLWRVVVMPTGMVGPGDFADTHLTRMIRDAASGVLPVSIQGGYDFADVRDVSDGIIRAAEFGKDGRTYLLSGHYIPASRMVAAVANAVGRQAPPTLPLWLARMIAPLAEFILKRRGTAPVVTTYSLRVLGEPGRFSSERAKSELGYRSRPFKDTLRDTLVWVQQRP